MMRICGWPLHAALLPLAQQYDLLIMPACFGLRRRSPVPLAAGASTLPAASAADAAAFGSWDVCILSCNASSFARAAPGSAGDEVVKISHRQDAVRAVWTRNHGDIALRPRFTVLASGSFFQQRSLSPLAIACSEPILGLDLHQALPRKAGTSAISSSHNRGSASA